MSLKVRGLESVMAQLREVDANLGQKALAKASRAAFKRVADMAKQLVPVDSGELRDAIRIKVLKPKKGDTVVTVGIQIATTTSNGKQARVAAAAFNEGQSQRLPPSRRWHFIELGTAHIAASPFLRPALDANAQGVVDDLSVQLRKQIADAIKKARGAK